MTFVITSTCLDLKDMACVEECPVDCIYVGGRKLYIQPDECINCGACEPVCPVNAIYAARKVPEDHLADVADNRAFFASVLPGRDAPLGSPGGAAHVGEVDADTPRVAGLPATG
ncbi:MAG: ferredoxin [Frankiales bacterium]|nr:ferredoxin [Frankiales bacterium]